MIRALSLVLLLCIAAPAGAAPAVRALFVGIDRYTYSSTNIVGAGFDDLRGAVGDVGRMKDGLRAVYRLDLDRPAGAACRSANAISTTLTDACATHAAIIDALRERVAASAAGDTVLFYFAGHGSLLVEDESFDQATLLHGTILAVDARNPAAPAAGDILDTELRGEIDAATARGVNIVTIFDSCNSGTATRASRRRTTLVAATRSAPGLISPAPRPPPPAIRGAGGGYRVHLAGAEDWQASREVTPAGGGETRGVFTTALVAAMRETPAGTFGDLAYAATRQTRRLLATSGVGAQTPHAEGALNATLGGPDRPTPLFEVASAADGFRLTSGALSGVTAGSRFALFASAADALRAGGAPLAAAVAGTPDAYGARLTIVGPAIAARPSRLVARETLHAWGDATLDVVASSPDAAQMVRITTALAGVAAVQRKAAGKAFTVGPRHPGGAMMLTDRNDQTLADLGALDAGFEDRLTRAIERVARAEALVALVNAAASAACIAPGAYDATDCPPLTQGPDRIVGVNVPLTLTVANRAAVDRYVYVLAIDARDAITLLIPRNRGIDPRLPPDQPQQRTIALDTPGRYRFVTITSGSPVNAAALEQLGAGARGVGAGASTDWTATLTQVVVREGP